VEGIHHASGQLRERGVLRRVARFDRRAFLHRGGLHLLLLLPREFRLCRCQQVDDLAGARLAFLQVPFLGVDESVDALAERGPRVGALGAQLRITRGELPEKLTRALQVRARVEDPVPALLPGLLHRRGQACTAIQGMSGRKPLVDLTLRVGELLARLVFFAMAVRGHRYFHFGHLKKRRLSAVSLPSSEPTMAP
jgi:hypothetical protein